ncbi:MAG: CvpA family protein [Acetobacter sp.]|nr:CvpA family protein [Acetobacter sp.]
MEPLNNVDVIILIGIALSMLVAFIRGFVKEILSILGLILFIALSTYLSPLILPWMNQYVESKTLSYVVIVLLIMAFFYAAWIISTDKLIAKVRTSTLSFMDRLFGLLFGFLRAVLILGFCYLVVKIALPEELKEGQLKESRYFVMAKSCSDLIEKMLPEDFVKNTVKSVEDMNKAEKNKNKSKDKKENKSDKKTSPAASSLPSELDQKQMNEMFEKLVNPEVKSNKKLADKPVVKTKENKGYDNKETKSLDRLIDLTTE